MSPSNPKTPLPTRAQHRLERQLPKWSELRPLMQFSSLDLDRRRARLNKAADLWDLRAIAQRRTPKVAFDYVDGAANQEISLDRTRQTFRDVEFTPGVLRDVSCVDLSTAIAGGTSALPFGIAPTGFTRMMHSGGEKAGVAAAHNKGIPFTLSTMGTSSIEEVAAAGPDGRRWFQLYLWKEREKSLALIERAAAAGYDTLLVTVDTAVAGARLRDVRNGMTIPPSLTLKTVLDASYRPEWWFNFLTTEPLKFATLSGHTGSIADLVTTMFDPTLTFDDLAWLRQAWKGRLFVKGIQSVDDARRVADCGVDGIVVSNHGGRQLDRAPVPLRLVPDIRSAVGSDLEIILDSGIMNGGDIVAALAAGADFTLIGRGYLYGLMAGGQEGVERAIDILRSEIQVVMQLLGVTAVSELTSDYLCLDREKPLLVSSLEHPTAFSR
ncbi:L-lactate dehydrogenase [cytochrome] (plasmid) [Corynebacterium occultum]|uniref:L-lactate dehydrogenase [cytochrome] n=1 Tax=Corynebacterium occultum TaxID=2675219 RepID=A0A6B8WA17_9CORY|nr:alpha-hydroxy acid oxidase [Corynebacterium occultum]QGU08797.1 L-lactate dehydrogenase [cytochrome] [Corynebacterium occultum]